MLKIDYTDLQKGLKAIDKLSRYMRKHIADSMNDGFDKGKPDAESRITNRYNVSAPNLGIKKASPGKLEGEITASGGMKKVEEFSPVIESPAPRQVVSVMIIRGRRKSILPSSRGPGVSGAFMPGSGGVLERRSATSEDASPVMTIGYGQMLYYHGISNPVRDLIAKEFNIGMSKRVKWSHLI
jgi:hypothetical protein